MRYIDFKQIFNKVLGISVAPEVIKLTPKRSLSLELRKSPSGDWYSTTRNAINGHVLGSLKSKGLLTHVELVKDMLFRELVASRSSANSEEHLNHKTE